MKLKNLLTVPIFALFFMVAFSPKAKAFTAVTSGNWSAAATWGGVAPGATILNTDIIIPVGIAVNLDMDVSFTGLLNVFSVSGTLNNTSAYAVNIASGALAGSGAVSISSMTFGTLATSTFTGTLTVNILVNTATSLAFSAIASISDTLNLDAGSLVLNAGANVTVENASTIKVNNGLLSVSGGVFNSSNAYNVMYVGTSKTASLELNTVTLNNLYVKLNNNLQSVTLSGNLIINGSLDLTTGALDFSGKQLTLLGDFNASAGAALTSTLLSDLTIAGNLPLSSGLVFSAASALHNFTITEVGVGNVQLRSPLNIAGTLSLVDGDFILGAGATLTMNAGSMINIGDGALTANTGTFVGTAAYVVEYSGGSNISGLELTGTGLTDLTLNLTAPASQILLSNDLTVAGNLDMSSGKLNLNGNNLSIEGTLDQSAASTFVGNSLSELELSMTSVLTDTVYFDQSNHTLKSLTVDLQSADHVVLGSGLTIGNELALVAGSIDIANYDLIMQSSATITGYSNLQYVMTSGTGSLQLFVNASSPYVTFPVGDTLNYSPASIQQTVSGTSGNFMVRATEGFLMQGTSGVNLALTQSVVNKTWFVEAEGGVVVNMNLKLGWIAASGVNGFDLAHSYISHFTNSLWDYYQWDSAVVGANATLELERSGITSLSPFGVADNDAIILKQDQALVSENLQLYPNPAENVLNFDFSGTSIGYAYKVMDAYGRMVLASELENNSGSIDLSSLNRGPFFIIVTDADNKNVMIKKFIKL